jgi:hypothetical protein
VCSLIVRIHTRYRGTAPCLGMPRIFLTAPHAVTALGRLYSQGEQVGIPENSQPAPWEHVYCIILDMTVDGD